MKLNKKSISWIAVYALVFSGILGICFFGSKAVTAMNTEEILFNKYCVIVDAGHGGVDGGTTSCTGVLESHLNLEIALRLDDLLHLVGIQTKMIRKTDVSIYTSGDTIAAKKVSDLKQRVHIIESTQNAVLISIHQNYFSQSQYSGAQVFYGKNSDGQLIAKSMQAALIKTVNPSSKRAPKKSSGVYLMEKITCPGVLVECGFLSNPTEEALLRDGEYQKKLCAVLAQTLSEYINSICI